MAQHLTVFAGSRRYPAPDGLKHLRKLVACLVLPFLFGGCTSMLADGMGLERAVAYPMRSPEYVMRDLGGNRYLLAQWDVPLNANAVKRVRYYDRNTGMLTHLPEAITAFREDSGNPLGALRYESDSPLQVAFFSRRGTNYDSDCSYRDRSSSGDKYPQRLCGYMDILLSLDGARSFGSLSINIPTSLGFPQIHPQSYEFAIVRNNTLYLGLYVDSLNQPEMCEHRANRPFGDTKKYATCSRRFKGPAVASENDDLLNVLAIPLPDNGGKPLPAEQIPRKLSADMLTGQALLDFDLGQPMARLETQSAAEPEPPTAMYKRANREAYIESLRAQYPEWAAHQTLNSFPRRQQWMSSRELADLRAKQTSPDNDPIEWVRFEKPAPK